MKMHDIVMNILSVETTEFTNKGAINYSHKD